MKIIGAIIIVCFLFIACSKQTVIVEPEQKLTKVENKETNFQTAQSIQISVAELLKSAESADKEGFPWCSLEINLGGKDNIRRLRNLWLRNEDDSRYRLVLKEDFGTNIGEKFNKCVCPGVCVFEVIDKTKPSPNNFGVIVFSERLKKGYSWVMKGTDLSSTRMTWASSTPYIQRISQNGEPVDKDNEVDLCWIRWNPTENKYACY